MTRGAKLTSWSLLRLESGIPRDLNLDHFGRDSSVATGVTVFPDVASPVNVRDGLLSSLFLSLHLFDDECTAELTVAI